MFAVQIAPALAAGYRIQLGSIGTSPDYSISATAASAAYNVLTVEVME
jgi:hypothetical protein